MKSSVCVKIASRDSSVLGDGVDNSSLTAARACTRNIDVGEAPVPVAQESMNHTVGIAIASNNIASRVDTVRAAATCARRIELGDVPISISDEGVAYTSRVEVLARDRPCRIQAISETGSGPLSRACARSRGIVFCDRAITSPCISRVPRNPLPVLPYCPAISPLGLML